MCAATSSTDDPSFEQLLASRLPDHLPDPSPVVSVSPVMGSGGIHPNVRRVSLASGERLIAKRHLFALLTRDLPHHLPVIERQVTDALISGGCSVPRVVCTIDDPCISIYDDVGSLTLDDVVQTSSPVYRSRLGSRVVESFLHISSSLWQSPPVSQDQIAPGVDEASVREQFLSITEHLNESSLREITRTPKEAGALTDGLAELITEAAQAPMLLGPADYNARNVVVSDDGRPYFIEWSKIGMDWPERRLVQYATGLGSGRTGGRPRTLIDRSAVERYADGAAWTDAETAVRSLDRHHLLFHILVLMRWVQTGNRAPQSLRQAIGSPLTDDDLSTRLRALIAFDRT